MLELNLVIPYLLIGALLGASLNYFQFGFSSSFSNAIVLKDTRGMRSIVIMLAVAIVLFAPLLATGTWQDKTFLGFIRPLSLSIPIGAFIFGVGMQIGCGCASGTLNRVGQFQPISIVTLAFMIVGGTLAAATFDQWQWLPKIEPFSFQTQFNWLPGLFIQLALLALLYIGLLLFEKKHTGSLQQLVSKTTKLNIHPVLLAGIALAVLNTCLLFFTGFPWSISSVFPFWGSQFIEALALPIDWSFWDYTLENESRMTANLFENPVSLTSFGVIAGAVLVTLIQSNKVKKTVHSSFFGNIMAGLMMGFGGVMASGCNIGAFFSGIASGSLHGWLWLVFALLGNIAVLKLRRIRTESPQ